MKKYLLPSEPITRDAAQAQGRKHYYTGEPCKRGHVAARYVANTGCIECLGRYRTGGILSTAPTCHMIPVHISSATKLTPYQVTAHRQYLQACSDKLMNDWGLPGYGKAT